MENFQANDIASKLVCYLTVLYSTVNASGAEKEDFLQEIKLMKKVSDGGNPYIVNMVGCCTLQEPLALILEFAPHGNLLNFIKALKKEVCMYIGMYH